MHPSHSLPPIQMPRQPAGGRLSADEARLLEKATWSYPLRHAPSPLASPVGQYPLPQEHSAPRLPPLPHPGIPSPDEGPRPALSQHQTRSLSHQSPPTTYRFSHTTPVPIVPSSARFSPYAHPPGGPSHQRRSSDVQAQVNSLNQSLHDSVVLSSSFPRSQPPTFGNRARWDSESAIHGERPRVDHVTLPSSSASYYRPQGHNSVHSMGDSASMGSVGRFSPPQPHFHHHHHVRSQSYHETRHSYYEDTPSSQVYYEHPRHSIPSSIPYHADPPQSNSYHAPPSHDLPSSESPAQMYAPPPQEHVPHLVHSTSFVPHMPGPRHSATSKVAPAAPESHPCPHEDCDEVFATPWQLLSHQSLHDPARPFQCSTCLLTFTRKHDMNRHIKSVHQVQAGEPLFACGICGQGFGRVDSLKRHVGICSKSTR